MPENDLDNSIVDSMHLSKSIFMDKPKSKLDQEQASLDLQVEAHLKPWLNACRDDEELAGYLMTILKSELPHSRLARMLEMLD